MSPAETRAVERFVFHEPHPAFFGSVAIGLMDLSEKGFQALHNDRFSLKKEALVSLELSGFNGPVVIKARLLWSRLRKKDDGSLCYVSGFEVIEERIDLIADVLDRVVSLKIAQVDSESLEKKKQAIAAKSQPRLPIKKEEPAEVASDADGLDLVRKARIYLKNNPEEYRRWTAKVRTMRGAPAGLALPMLAVWEFLGHRVEPQVVKLAFELHAATHR